jgi:cytochrome c biogenesis protein CcmG/thiol:disulfide interchange protein DsbE
MAALFSFAAIAQTPASKSTPETAPAFNLKTLDGGHVSLADYKGKVVLVNFWATYCVPCKTETPWFVQLQKEHAAEGLQVIGITMDEPDNKRLPKFVAEMGVNYPIAFGDYDLADSYDHVQALPVTFLVTRDGKIAKTIRGIESKDKLDAEVTKLLAAK